MKTGLSPLLAFVALLPSASFAIDGNGNSQSDVWEMYFGASGLSAAADTDSDGWSNLNESLAGTDPLDAKSWPKAELSHAEGQAQLQWQGVAGKRYEILSSTNLTSWTPLLGNISGANGAMSRSLLAPGPAAYFKVQPSDVDSDADGVSDWEEGLVGFSTTTTRTGRFTQTDSQRITAGLSASATITVSVYDDTCSEHWPDPAVFVLRRSAGLKPLTVNFSLGGTATSADYAPSSNGSVSFAAGQREAFVSIAPLEDADDGESTETVVLTALAGTGYTVGAANTAIASIINQAAGSGPSAKEAARFLLQAAFGPDQDAADDPDQIPENVEEVMSMGIEAWIDDQLTRPVGRLKPMLDWQFEQPSSGPNDAQIYNDRKMNAWWGRAMGLPKLRPDATEEQLPDPLRQRVAFALSQIFVISERLERLATEPTAMAHFYDKLLENSFGNFEDLLRDVTLHPCMANYLSYLDNRKADPIARTFPDENYAREVMQLFSIGLWMLNPDGTRVLDGNGQPIPTYSNANITEFARVFTGLTYGQLANGQPANWASWDGDFTVPLKGWDEEHDLGPKSLLLGATTPARTASLGNTGTATMADVNAAVSNLFNHPNVGPFIGKLLIQRLVTSNPSPEYIGRVSAAFNAAPRGDLGRTVKAILMDPEARSAEKMDDPHFGKLREPYLKVVNMARAFNASASTGWYYLDAFDLDHAEEPFNSPSVFNFYLPSYSPPGAMASAGLVAPEMQIVNASSGVTAPNYYWTAITGGLHRWGVGVTARTTRLNLTQELAMSTMNSDSTDALIRRLDLVLTGGTLTPQSLQIIREEMMRIDSSYTSDWSKERLRVAIYLIICSPEYSVQH